MTIVYAAFRYERRFKAPRLIMGNGPQYRRGAWKRDLPVSTRSIIASKRMLVVDLGYFGLPLPWMFENTLSLLLLFLE